MSARAPAVTKSTTQKTETASKSQSQSSPSAPAKDAALLTSNASASDGIHASTRLYITPLTPALLPKLLGPTSKLSASSEFYSSSSTFPENQYGFITLPTEEAQRLRKKLHNSVFQGMKMRVEEARAEKPKGKDLKGAQDAVEDDGLGSRRSKRKDGKKAKSEGVLKGEELEQGRKVKRGWTGGEEKDGKKRKRGERETVIFKSRLPDESRKASTDKLDKKRKKSAKKDVELKEFDKTGKVPGFLRETPTGGSGKAAKEYVEGRGWVDEDGNVIEEVHSRRTRKTAKKAPEEPRVEPTAPGPEDDPESSGSESDVSSVASEPEPESEPEPATDLPDSEMTEPQIMETDLSAKDEQEKKPSALEALFKRPSSANTSGVSKNKPRSLPAPIDVSETSFSFFDSANVEPSPPPADTQDTETQDVEESGTSKRAVNKKLSLLVPPQTPFTRRDLEDRALRSAAPTPDTAAIGRKFRAPWRGSSLVSNGSDKGSVERAVKSESIEGDLADTVPEEDIEMEGAKISVENATGDAEVEPADNDDGKEQTDFEKKYYAERGQNQKAYKGRLREMRKSVRQGENRRIGGKPGK